MIVGAIEPDGDDTEELSMKAPMSVSKPVDLGKGVPNYASRNECEHEPKGTMFTQARALSKR